MERKELFQQMNRLGMDTQAVLNRFMNNEMLLLSFVRQLPETLDLTRVHQALKAEDDEAFYMAVHNLKGLAGNLSIEPIHECAQAILVELQASKFKNKKKLHSLIQELEIESNLLSKLVRQYLEEEAHG